MSNEEMLKELRIQNLLTVINIMNDTNLQEDTKTYKVLNYIFDSEMSALQFDIALFPKKQEVREYNFHEL